MDNEEYIRYYGCIEHLCFYRMRGQDFVRMKSNLTTKRVKSDPAFANTMKEANLLGRAAKIASIIYQALPKEFRQFWMYRAFTGEIVVMLKNGRAEKEAHRVMYRIYVSEWERNSNADTTEKNTSVNKLVVMPKKQGHKQLNYISDDLCKLTTLAPYGYQVLLNQGIGPPRSLVA